MRARVLRDDAGAALVSAIALLAAMLGLGLGLLSIVDVQSKASATQREGDASFNLADSALSSAAFVLSRNWPSSASASQPWTQGATCNQQTISGGVATTTDTTIAGQIQKLVAQASAARNGPANATWAVKICDAGNEATWSPNILGNAPYDSTGRRTLTDPNGNQFMVRRVWVRAEATVNGRKRAVASLVQVTEKGAFPTGYGVVGGKMGFTGSTTSVTQSILNNQTTLGTLTNSLVGTTPVVTGKIGIRCGLLSELCLDSIASTITGMPLLTSTGLTSGQVVQYGAATTVSTETTRLLRERAVRNGTYFASIASGTPCIPTGTTVTADSVVFVEKVGNGSQSCTLQAVPSRTIGTVVVGGGRIAVSSTSPTTMSTLTGVLYALNKQEDKTEAVVTVGKGAKIKGAVFVDGGGIVAVYPPDFTVTNAVCSALLGSLLCALTPVTSLVDTIIGAVGLPALLTAVLPQLSTYGPVVEYDAAMVSTQTVYGSSGVVQGTFRQVPAG